ncbi:MAG TPA: SDR family NAD(P)-dependent oxidoreductase [Rubrivivax sp.]|nr:SDR family NAD(P)-dependent oxidoreductase [Rubrivivax sp.]
MDFEGRCVMVSGASGNLGRALARVFAARGARLVLLGSRAESLARAFGSGDERRLLVPADLLDARQVEAAAAAAIGRYGRIDVLCNLAGGFGMGPAVHETPPADWDHLMNLNVRTLLHTAHAVVPRMLAAGGGRIVNVGAYAARAGAAGMGAYAASKAAVLRLTESMSAELRERGINVNCVLPTIIDTPENRAAMPTADPARWVAPADLAEVIAFLASDAARAVHGAALPVTGLS